MTRLRSDVAVQLIQSMGSEEVIVMAAQASTLGAESKPDPAKVKGLIPWLVKNLHSVPLEHTAFTFRIEAPIFVTRQILKHRISSISEHSGRYSELELEFYVPDWGRKTKQVGKTGDYNFVHDQGTARAARRWITLGSRAAGFAYRCMLRAGVSKEVARMVMPVNTYSTMFVTMNLRSWLNFLSLRKDWGSDAAIRSHAQYEIEQVAEQIALAIAPRFPSVWKGFIEGGYRAV